MKTIAKDKIRDVMVTRTAIKCLVDEDIVTKIVNFQAKDASEAVKKYKEVEFAGFGKFLFLPSKARRRIVNLEQGVRIVEEQLKGELADVRRAYLVAKLNGMIEKIKYYKEKLGDE